MTEQWQELKDTIIELRDNDGTGTQQEVCKFLANYMDILEKQMQQPCEDAISRSDMLDAIGHGTTYTSEELQRIIKGLPPVNPQPCSDLISRKAILEEFENDQYHLEFCKEHHIERSISMEMVRIRLHDLPSVNPQPCKDTRMIDKSNFNMEQYKTDIQSAYDCGKASVAPCEDCISRQAVLDIVDSYSESKSNVEDVTQDIISDIMALSPVTSQPKMGEWISVEDRLPEEGEEVLVWYRYWRYGEYNNWYYTYGIGYQYTGIFSVIDGGVRQSVYAWQELPEQYIVEPQESEKDEHMTADEFAELFAGSED